MRSELTKAGGFFAVFTFAFSMLIPILPSYFEKLGFNETQLGWLYAILPLMMFLISPLAGSLSDKFGRNFILSCIVITDIVAVLLYLLTNNPFIAVFARFLEAISIATAITVSIARVQDSLLDETRGKYSGYVFSFQSAAKILAPFIGGLLADHLFLKAPFILTLIVVLTLFRLPGKQNEKKFSLKDFQWLSHVKTFLGYRKLQGMAILGIVHHSAFPAIQFFLPLFVVDYFSLSYTYVGIALFVHQLPTIMQFFFGRFSDKSPAGFVLTGSIITGLATLALAFAHTYWLFLAFLFIRGIGNGIWNVSGWNLMSRIGTYHKIQGKVVGSYTSISKLGAFISSPLSGLIVMHYGVHTLFGVVGVFLLAGIVLSTFFLKGKLLYN